MLASSFGGVTITSLGASFTVSHDVDLVLEQAGAILVGHEQEELVDLLGAPGIALDHDQIRAVELGRDLDVLAALGQELARLASMINM